MLLIGVFAIQHSVMARQGFKRWWTRIVPASVERSTYVLFASFALLLLYWQWQPIPTPVWTVNHPVAAGAIDAVFWLGWVVLVVSTFLLNHFELFGLSQVFMHLFGKQPPEAKFRTPLLYRYVRHPIYLGILLAVWATPAMTVGHLVYSLGITAYILIGIQLEEHDLTSSSATGIAATAVTRPCSSRFHAEASPRPRTPTSDPRRSSRQANQSASRGGFKRRGVRSQPYRHGQGGVRIAF